VGRGRPDAERDQVFLGEGFCGLDLADRAVAEKVIAREDHSGGILVFLFYLLQCPCDSWQGVFLFRFGKDMAGRHGASQFVHLVCHEVPVDLVCYHVDLVVFRKFLCPLAGPLEKGCSLHRDELLGIVLPGERPEPGPHAAGKDDRFHGCAWKKSHSRIGCILPVCTDLFGASVKKAIPDLAGRPCPGVCRGSDTKTVTGTIDAPCGYYRRNPLHKNEPDRQGRHANFISDPLQGGSGFL